MHRGHLTINERELISQLRAEGLPPAAIARRLVGIHRPGNEPFAGKFLDLVMLLIPGGQERAESEYRTLFNEAGFELSRIVPTNTELSIVEGVKQ